MFYNDITRAWTDDAVEENRGRWYIKIGFCGCNSHANNGNGYANQAAAEAAISYYQNKSPYINDLKQEIM